MKKMLIGALTLSLAVAASAGALAEKYNLMFSHTLTENDPYHQAFVQWADAVSERTNGELTIDVYANAQLGAEEDVIEQMRMGATIPILRVWATMCRKSPCSTGRTCSKAWTT